MKKTLYPKTQRIWLNNKVIITEKLDWSNLWIFMLWWELIIAQRNNVYRLSEAEANIAYKWLIGWLDINKDRIDLCEWSWVFWEWIGMWQIWYWDYLENKFYIFAKANIDENFDVRNINYDHSLFIYPFLSKTIPDFMGIVPVVWEYDFISVDMLDKIYDEYAGDMDRKCEWFVCYQWWSISKYVRYKDWKESPHKP